MTVMVSLWAGFLPISRPVNTSLHLVIMVGLSRVNIEGAGLYTCKPGSFII